MTTTKILIDCDPGHDDAVAILYAARHLDLVGVTTVHGNNTLDNVTRNALSVLTLAGLDTPLAKGCAEPIAGPRIAIGNAHGKTGLDGADLPEPEREPVDMHAVDFLIECARRYREELVLAVIGPATNVALAIKREPRLPRWLREISIMGGSAGIGNVQPTVEFNAWADPEAAAILFASGAPIRMVGYDVTRVTGTRADDIARLRAGGRTARTIGGLIDFYRERQRALFGLEIAPMHDACAIVPYVDASLVTYRDSHVAVELNGPLTRGMTVCDLRGLTSEGAALRSARPANAKVAVATDRDRLIDGVVDTLLSFG